MTALIDRILPDGRSIAEIVFALADSAGVTFNIVDVGARNGNYMLPRSYAKRTRLIGFEPNRVEYEKLVTGTTDAKAAGLSELPYREKAYHPHALWSESTERTLFLTAGAGSVTLMGPASEQITSNMWREQDCGQSFFDRIQKVLARESVHCVTLDEAWHDDGSLIDILKLDVEGAELDVLTGAQSLLRGKRILLIYSEVLFVPYYERRITLGHQQVFLDELGYRLIKVNLDHPSYSWRPTDIRPKNDQWLVHAGDAIFVLDPDRNALSREEGYRLGVACMAMGFNGLGLNLISNAGEITTNDRVAIETLANTPPLSRKLHQLWLDTPRMVHKFLLSVGLRN
jgi:FkbM family methyltransferase